MCPLEVRAAEVHEIHLLAALINPPFRVEAFFVEGDRTSPEQIASLMEKGSFLLIEEDSDVLGR